MKSLLFDLDGTLTDSRDGIIRCIAHALHELGETVPEPADFERFIGPPLVESFAVLLAAPDDERIARAIALYRERYVRTGLYENRVFPGIPGLLHELSERGLTLFVATSKPSVYATRIAEHFGLDRFFHGIYGPECDGTRNDKAELLAHLLEVEGLVAADTVMIGDRKHDVIGARANGLAAIGVTWGYGSRAELAAAGADAIVDTMPELITAITRTSVRSRSLLRAAAPDR
jgi:phosphoglycolate phosphatase